MCMSPPFLPSSRPSAFACGIPRVMAVDGGLKGTQVLVNFIKTYVNKASLHQTFWLIVAWKPQLVTELIIHD